MLSWFVFNRSVKLNSTKSKGKMKKSSFSHSVCKVHVSTFKVISVISDRAHKKVCWLGLNVHIHISILFLCPFVFILPLEVWGDNFLQQEASVSRML